MSDRLNEIEARVANQSREYRDCKIEFAQLDWLIERLRAAEALLHEMNDPLESSGQCPWCDRRMTCWDCKVRAFLAGGADETWDATTGMRCVVDGCKNKAKTAALRCGSHAVGEDGCK